MTQKQIDQAVGRATGASPATIRRLGFGLEERPSDHRIDERLLALTGPARGTGVPLSCCGAFGSELTEYSRGDTFEPHEHFEFTALEPLVKDT